MMALELCESALQGIASQRRRRRRRAARLGQRLLGLDDRIRRRRCFGLADEDLRLLLVAGLAVGVGESFQEERGARPHIVGAVQEEFRIVVLVEVVEVDAGVRREGIVPLQLQGLQLGPQRRRRIRVQRGERGGLVPALSGSLARLEVGGGLAHDGLHRGRDLLVNLDEDLRGALARSVATRRRLLGDGADFREPEELLCLDSRDWCREQAQVDEGEKPRTGDGNCGSFGGHRSSSSRSKG